MPSESSVAGAPALPKGAKLGWIRTLNPLPTSRPALNILPQLPHLPGVSGSSATGRFLAG